MNMVGMSPLCYCARKQTKQVRDGQRGVLSPQGREIPACAANAPGSSLGSNVALARSNDDDVRRG